MLHLKFINILDVKLEQAKKKFIWINPLRFKSFPTFQFRSGWNWLSEPNAIKFIFLRQLQLLMSLPAKQSILSKAGAQPTALDCNRVRCRTRFTPFLLCADIFQPTSAAERGFRSTSRSAQCRPGLFSEYSKTSSTGIILNLCIISLQRISEICVPYCPKFSEWRRTLNCSIYGASALFNIRRIKKGK